MKMVDTLIKVMEGVLNELDVYFVIQMTAEYDRESLVKCLKVFLETHLQKQGVYKLNIFEDVSIEYTNNDCDIIERGLMTFIKMYERLKLKSKNESWFIYVSNGYIKTVQHNVSLVLLNKQPSKCECLYNINKSPINVQSSMLKQEKLQGLKTFTKGLTNILQSKQTIKYDNVVVS
jgi:hypothetical protein